MPHVLLALLVAVTAVTEEPVQPDAAALRQAIDRLQVAGRVLYVAAHPDDENTRLLAWLVGERGVDAAYVSMTRGGGGQNLVGTEQAELLGLIRTLELLEARRLDGAEQHFTRARDFGYSKGPDETLAFWGRERALGDLVRVIRRVQPDVIITRFADSGRNHGHHTASAILAREAFEAAGDAARFPEQGLPVWQADRLLRNVSTWRLPEDADMSAYLAADVGGFSALLGRSWGEIAAASRTMHKSQGFGSPPQRGPITEYFEPLAGTVPVGDPLAGLDLTWRRFPRTERLRKALATAARTFDPAAPHRALPALVRAHRAMAAAPDRAVTASKRRDLEEVILGCAGLWLAARAETAAVGRGGALEIALQALNRSPARVRLLGIALPGGAELAESAKLAEHAPYSRKATITVPADAPLARPHWLRAAGDAGFYGAADEALIGAADTPAALRVVFDVEVAGLRLQVERPVVHAWRDRVDGELQRRVEVLPAATATPGERVLVVAGARPGTLEVTVQAGFAAVSGRLLAEAPAGWSVQPAEVPLSLSAAGDRATISLQVQRTDPAAAAGKLRLVTEVAGQRGSWALDVIDHPHIPTRSVLRPAEVKLVPVDLQGTGVRVGYVPGSGDRVAEGLRQVGFSVTELPVGDLDAEALNRFDAVVLGVRAFNVHPELRFARAELMAWVERGGRLLVQYNTHSRWSPLDVEIGPYPLELGRDRVTDEAAALVAIDPADPVLTSPNRLGPADFDGWVQERGLYFAASWDPRYRAVFRSADPGEGALDGGLLVARHGRGVYIYTGLSFFRQLPAGVPGAYRLLANLLAHAPR